jgi:tRNA(fMet)-specific endonuclease VapC
LGLMLDSTAVVAAERQGKNARQLLEAVTLETGDEGIAVSAVTVLELAHGITRADTSERRERRQRFLDELLTGVPVQPVTVPIRSPCGTDRRPEASEGCPHSAIGSADRASALELGYGVGTANVRHFQLIPGLNVIPL